MKIKTMLFVTLTFTIPFMGCKKNSIKSDAEPKDEMVTTNSSSANLSRNSEENRIIAEFLQSEEHRLFRQQNFGQLDMQNAQVSEKQTNDIRIIAFPINRGGNEFAKLYVYYRPNIQSSIGRFVGVIESFTSSNGHSVQQQVNDNEITGIIKFQTVNAELIKSMTMLQNSLVGEVDGNPAYKPFDWSELGRCMKNTIMNMGPGSAIACALDVPLCLTVIFTDCVFQQMA